MANRSKDSYPTPAEVEATQQIYDIARQEANLEIAKLKGEIEAAKEDGIAIGAIKANKAHRSFNDFFDAMVLYRAKKNKTYKQNGLTWEAFCEAAGYPRRTAEDIISDIAPVMETFSGNFAAFSGVGLKEIRYLGKTKAGDFAGFDDDGNLVIGEEKIPNTPEDIIAYINHQKETHQKTVEETEAALSAQKKIVTAKEKVINELERDLKRLERSVPRTEFTPEEQDAINLLAQVQSDFLGWISDIHKKIKPNEAPEIALRSFYYLLILMSKICLEERMRLEEAYRDAEAVPWEITDFEMEAIPEEVLADNLPSFVGQGIGKKLKAKMEQREAQRAAKKGTEPEKEN